MKKLFPSLLLGLAVGVSFPGTVHGQSLKDSFNQQPVTEVKKEFCKMIIPRMQFFDKTYDVYLHSDGSIYTHDIHLAKFNYGDLEFNCKKAGYLDKPFRYVSKSDKGMCKLRDYGEYTKRFTIREWELTDTGLVRYSLLNDENCQTGAVSAVPGKLVQKHAYKYKEGF